MRAITLVKRIEFDFSGNVLKNALTLGDVDNDGCNELIVGNQNGDVCIFKVNLFLFLLYNLFYLLVTNVTSLFLLLNMMTCH